MDSAIDVAKYMLSKKSLTPKQIQKLLYYAYSLYLVKYNDEYNSENMNRLFEDKIEAWLHGPVVRNVYEFIKSSAHSNEIIERKNDVHLSSKRIENFIDKILWVFGQYSGYELELMTHSEKPWKVTYIDCDGEARCDKVIDDELIFDYYSKKYKKQQTIH